MKQEETFDHQRIQFNRSKQYTDGEDKSKHVNLAVCVATQTQQIKITNRPITDNTSTVRVNYFIRQQSTNNDIINIK